MQNNDRQGLTTKEIVYKKKCGGKKKLDRE